MPDFNRIYIGRAGRPELRGKLCKVLETWKRHGKHNVWIEFEDGEQVICPVRCIRKVETASEA